MDIEQSVNTPPSPSLETSTNPVNTKKVQEISASLKKMVSDTYANQEFLRSVFLIIQKTLSDQDIPRPFLDHIISSLTDIQKMISNVPIAAMSLDDSLEALQKLSQQCTYATLCKTASLIPALFAKTISLLQFIDQHGGQTITACIQFDEQYLGGIAARVGSSFLFVGTLSGFKNELMALSAVFAVVNAATFTRSKNLNTELATSNPNIQTSFDLLCFLTIANETCKIVTMFCAASTEWPVLCFGVISAVLRISKNLYKTELDKQQENYQKKQEASVQETSVKLHVAGYDVNDAPSTSSPYFFNSSFKIDKPFSCNLSKISSSSSSR